MTNRTWLGGGNNQASNPRDWSPNGAPHAGDTLTISSGTMNVSGNDLKGASLNVSAFGSLGTVININVTGTVALSDMHQNADHLNFSGGKLRFIGTSTFDGNGGETGQVTFHDDLIGSGTLQLFGGNHDGIRMEIDGSVAGGLTFAMAGGTAPTNSLQIDHPSEFHALIDFPSFYPGLSGAGGQSEFSFVAFMGLHATSSDIKNDMLRMFDGKKLVDSVRIQGGQGLQLQQNSAGVILSSGFSSVEPVPGGPGGTPIPLHIS